MQRSADWNRRDVLRSGVGGGLALVAGTGVVSAGSEATAQAAPEADVTVTIDNEGASAWRVTSVEGDTDVPPPAPTDESNPTLTLVEGVRYAFENEGWNFHPLAFRESEGDGTALLSQSTEGPLETDPDVNWTDTGDAVAFTVTETLAERLDEYWCTVHPGSMVGGVETVSGVARYDTNGDGVVQAQEVLRVIAAYNGGEDIGAQEVLAVIAAYNGDGQWDGVEA